MNFTFIAGLGYTANAATPDTTAPTLSNPNDGTPTSDGCTSPSVDTDEGNGTMYWAVLTNGGSCTDAQLKAGSGGNIVAGKAGNQAVSGTGTQTTSNVTGLSASTDYELVWLHRDAAGNDSSQATVGLTTTAGGGDIEFVQKNTGSGSAVETTSITLNGTTAGNFLVLCVSLFGGDGTNTAPSDGTNTWNTTTAATASGSSTVRIYYAMNIAGGNVTVSVDNGSGYYYEASIAEFSGLATSSALDQEASDNGGGSADDTPISGTTGTTSQNDELVVACLAADAANPDLGIDLPSGYTNIYTHQTANDTEGHSSDYLIVSSTGAQSASWGTLSGTAFYSAKICTFKKA